MIGFRCECGPAIDCTYPKCKEGVETNGKDITKRLRDYARDYTTTTYHDDLIQEAATEIESLRQQVMLLREAIDALEDFADTVAPFSSFWEEVWPKHQEALAATEPKP